MRTSAVLVLVLAACFDPDLNGNQLGSSEGAAGNTTDGVSSGSTSAPNTTSTTSSSDAGSIGSLSTDSSTSGSTPDDGENTGGDRSTYDGSSTVDANTGSEDEETSDAEGAETCASGCLVCDIPEIECNGACLDLRADPENCGACGRSCAGMACDDGACEPLEVFSQEEPILDVTVQGPFLYFLDLAAGSTIRRVSTSGGTATGVGWTLRPLERILTDESHHYSYLFDSDGSFYVAHSNLVDTINESRSTFEWLNEPTIFPTSPPAFEMSDSRLFVVWSTEQYAVYHVPKTGGELTIVSGASVLGIRRVGMAVDDFAVYGVQGNAVMKLPISAGDPTPIAALLEGETASGIAVTDHDVILSSDLRVSMTSKDGGELRTLHEATGIYRVFTDATTSTAFFLQAAGDAETCSEGSVLSSIDLVGGQVRRLSTMPAGCVTRVTFDADALYWIGSEGAAIYRVSR